MARRLACVHGHEWEVTDDVTASTAGLQVLCPICGAAVDVAAQEVAEESAAHAATVQFPGAIPIAEAETDLPGPDSAVAGAQKPASPGPGRASIAQPPSFPAVPGYEILEELGRGGMGVVLKARQVKLDRLVALKVLPPASGEDPAFAERFGREARALARLSHPHIVTVHDFGQVEGQSYFVMEFIAGMNLRQRLRSGRLPLADVLAIMKQLCEALQYAHEEGIIHRDIKPENILLDRYGRVRIADFGLAKLTVRTTVDYTLTGPMQVMGTWNYMAPEQLDNPQAVDHRADIYALGVVFYEMLTGSVPRARFPLPSETGANAALDEVVLRALERDPERRYQRVSEFWAQLESIAAADSAAGARQVTVHGPGAPPSLAGQGPARPVSAPPDAGEPVVSARPVSGELRTAPSSPEISPRSLLVLLDETDTALRRIQHISLLAGALLALEGLLMFRAIPILAVFSLIAAVVLFVVANRTRQGWELNYKEHAIRFENGVFSGSKLFIDGVLSAHGMVGYRVETRAQIHHGAGAGDWITALTEAGLFRFRLRLLAEATAAGEQQSVVPRAGMQRTPGGPASIEAEARAQQRLIDPASAAGVGAEPIPGYAEAMPRVLPQVSEADLDAARQHTRGPAIGLICAALTNCLPGTLVPAVILVAALQSSQRKSDAAIVWIQVAMVCAPFFMVGISTLIAARNLRNLQLFWLVLFAVAIAMVPLTPGAVLGIPCGLWAMVVLRRADVRAAFRLDREAARMTPWASVSPAIVCESARRLARGPAAGLACAAIFNLVMAIAIPGVWLASEAPFTATPATAGMKLGMSAVLYVPALLVGAFTIVAALNLRKLELYWLVLLATLTAMLPITPGFVIGLPCGIWALAVLSRADVRAAFRYLTR
jgi:serine/threonine protein kinase